MSTEKERQEWADMAHTILTGERWDTNDRVMLANSVETLLREVVGVEGARDMFRNHAIAGDKQLEVAERSVTELSRQLALANRRIEKLREALTTMAQKAHGLSVRRLAHITLNADDKLA